MGEPLLSRRELVRGVLGAAGILATLPVTRGSIGQAAASQARPSHADRINQAVRTERWIRTTRIANAERVMWPSDPLTANSVQTNLYTGTPGHRPVSARAASRHR